MRKRGVSPTIVISVIVILLAIIVFYSLYQNSVINQEQVEQTEETQDLEFENQNNQEVIVSSYLDCVNYRCVEVNGTARNHQECFSPGQKCEITELCGNGICDANVETPSLCPEDCTNKNADLVVKTPIEITKTNGGVVIRAEVQNVGGKRSALSRTRMSVLTEDFYETTKILQPGESQVVAFSISLSLGQYEVLVRADLDNLVNESNEDNNIVAQTFIVE